MEFTDSTTRSKAAPGSERMPRVVSIKLTLLPALGDDAMKGSRLVPASVCAYEKTPTATAKIAKAAKRDSFPSDELVGDIILEVVDVVDFVAMERDFGGVVGAGFEVAS